MKNLALFLISLTVSALVAEVGLRFAGFNARELAADRFFTDGEETTWSVPDSQLGWVNKAGVSISIEHGGAPMTFWDQGRRATRENLESPGDGAAVMFVGGSNAQSYGVTDQESFPYLLGQRNPALWIENFGNGGYSSAQALLMAKRAAGEFYDAIVPQLIVLTFADSHVVRNVSDQSWVYSISDSQGRYVSPPHFRLEGNQLVFWPFRTIGPWPLETSSVLITTLHNVWMQSVLFDSADESVPVTKRVLARFAKFAETIGSDLLVVILEDRTNVSGQVFEGASFPVLDCSGYERSDPKGYLLGGNGHPNAKLHAHFADCIGTWMSSYFESRNSQGGL
ncbi:MAG: hypothetical protein HN793_07560 [Rhodospirillaceae bacterium]|nr:hypothetical protein [Rhodospirillaceae bacterium]MBT5566289.1 hypothetical protein [Rhodospirillaceae bacterium]MBT6088067.1 hypothetical protein [Rhodospirillaceae bacterium]MBT6960841.1 hypothetical protein [Rhodospirillaceae bacterium]MBT7450670.1 hypothetical protein [Rhodospirillaceae bacterium]